YAAIWDIAAGLAILHAAGGVAIGLSGAPLDTSTMLDGRQIHEPAILAPPHQISALRQIIRRRGYDKVLMNFTL
ncbi:MAG TPA: inositol monophosphatase family protein, partial [Roseiflexaceae bacterium]|nr:inositol monophosphatase family protein [Roseiflexaceae bacterium]